MWDVLDGIGEDEKWPCKTWVKSKSSGDVALAGKPQSRAYNYK